MTDKKASQWPPATDLAGAEFTILQDGSNKRAATSLLATTLASVLLNSGGNDNRVMRSDGTGGGAIQSSSMEVDDSGNIAAFGGQIKFPAAQNASSDANTLDDYEEGTFTPGMTFGGSATGVTFSNRDGRYVKIGSMVWVGLRISLTNNGSGNGDAVITGLPFTTITAPDAARGLLSAEYWANTSGVVGALFAAVGSGSTSAELRTGGASAAAWLTDSNITNTATIYLGGWYRAAA